MKLHFNYVVIFLFVLFYQSYIIGQNTSIKVIDSKSKEGIPYANIVLNTIDGEFLKGITTDSKGVANFELNQRANYKVSFLGFESIEGQISQGEHITLEMNEHFNMLDDVVITGQYTPKKSDRSIYKIDVVDSRELAQRGVSNLAEALSQETFIRLTTDPSTGTSLELQGMGGENVKYLIDGVPITGRVAGDIDLSQINMDNVDHIEIVQGPMSVEYGTSALAGVINIITKKNTTNKNILKLNSYTSNKNNYNFGFYGSVIRGKNTISASGSRNMFQGIDINLNVDGDNESGKDRYMEFKPKLVYNGDLEYAFNKKDFSLKAKTDFMRSELRNYLNYSPSLKAYDNYYITLRSLNSFTISDKFTESLFFNVVGAYTFFKRDAKDILSDLTTLTHTETGTTSTTFHNIMSRGKFTLAPKDAKLNYQFGWDINYDKGTGERIDDKKAEMSDFAAFVSAQWEPLKSFSVQPGLRFVSNDTFESPLIPSINLQWKIINDINFRISYAKGFRAPSLKELYLDFHDSNHNLTGNADLLAETTDSYNSSLTYKFNGNRFLLKFEPSVYYNKGKDVISLIGTDEENGAEYSNLGGRKTLGTNVSVSFIHNAGLGLSAGYSLTDESYDFEGTNDWTKDVYYSNYTFNTKYNFKKYKMIIMANYKLYGKTPSLRYKPDDSGDLYNVYTEALNDLEATISKQFFTDKLNIVVGAKNLFDNYSSRTYGYIDEEGNPNGKEYLSPINYGRTYFIKLNYKL